MSKFTRWKGDPMNRWYPSKGGKTVLQDRDMQRMDDRVMEENVFDAVRTLCTLTASTVTDLARTFLGEAVGSIKELTYGQATMLVRDYASIHDERNCFYDEDFDSKKDEPYEEDC